MRALSALLLIIPIGAAAADASTLAGAAPPEEAPRRAPLWEAGVFGVAGSQQAYPGAKQQVRSAIVLPFAIYRGEWLRAEQGGVGVRASRTASTEIDIGFSGSFGSAASDNDVRRGLPNIGTLVEFGPRVKWDLGKAPFDGRWRAALPLRGVFDLSHRFNYRGLALAPDIGWGAQGAGGWTYGASLGLLVGDERLTGTFYGVGPGYATATRPAYEAKAGLIATRLTLSLGKRLSEDWRFFAFARADTVEGAANRHSPLVDRPTGGSIGIGFSWTGLRSEREGAP
jgi:outer membrane scaffolding protein for murein synthesis (MipA/OmpV family)